MIIDCIQAYCQMFAERSADRSTLDEIIEMSQHWERWKCAHDLFDRIRRKCIQLNRSDRTALHSQYQFEESCAKTLYNMSRGGAPFDADSPFWIVPSALGAGRMLGFTDAEIISVLDK